MGKRKRATEPTGGNGSGPPVTKKQSREANEREALLADKSPFAEGDLSRADHDRERRLYQLLGSFVSEDRLRAAEVIVSALVGADGTRPVPESVFLRHLERRLLRGLASGSEASRIGFSYVLTELLAQLFGGTPSQAAGAYPSLTFDRILDLLLEKTQPGTNVPGQEERDHYWGRLFGLHSFVESGVLFVEDGTGGRRWDSVLRHLLQLGRKKVWMRTYACFTVVQAISRGRHLPGKKTVAATLETIAADSSVAKTPEGLGIWLAALGRFPDMKLPAPWTAPLASNSHKEVVAVLRNSGDSSEGEDNDQTKPAKQGNASAQLHFVWDLLLGQLISRQPLGAPTKQFDSFWMTVVDQVYFTKGASDHQKLAGFKIFQKALAVCADKGEIYPALFSNNLMSCLINQASNATPRLHRAAVQLLRDIEKQVEKTPGILPQLLECLLGTPAESHGVYNFDERVKGTGDGTKPVENILRFTTPGNIEAVVAILRKGALHWPDPKNDQKALRIYADYLFRLVSRTSSNSNGESADEVASVGSAAFQALSDLAYPTAHPKGKTESGIKKRKAPKDAMPAPFPPLNQKTQATSRKHLLSAAGALVKRPDDFAPFCRTILAIDLSSVGAAMDEEEIQAQVIDARQQLKELLPSFSASPDQASAQARQGLAVLLAVSLLQLYHEPRPDALEVLQDIKACGEKLDAATLKKSSDAKIDKKKDGKASTKGDKKKKKCTDEEEEEEEDMEEEHSTADEPDIGQVLTEVLLAMLAESSQLTRQTSLQVFAAFTPYMSAEALDNLTDVLAAEENTSGYRALFSTEDEDDEDEDDEYDDEDADDVEMLDEDADVGGDDSDASDDSVEDDEDDEDGSEDESDDASEDADEDADGEKTAGDGEKVPAAKSGLEAALMKTFRISHTLDRDADSSSGEESDMSDDAMLALDGHLAGHLKLIKDKTEGHKKERADARRKVVELKHRVLDLLETYIKRGSGDTTAGEATGAGEVHEYVVFRLLPPLAVLVRDTKEPSLAQKAVRIVQDLQKRMKKERSKKSTSLLAPAVDSALAILTTLHEAANDRTQNRAFAAVVSKSCQTVISTLYAADRTTYQRVAEIYRSTKEQARNGWTVRKEIFDDFDNWRQSVGISV